MTSNCYIVVDEESKHCICIDPASEKSESEISYVKNNELTLDYILLTHEHTDHTWGVNALLSQYPKANVICSSLCRDALPKEAKAYFQLYYDDPNYSYNVERVDCTTEDLNWQMQWSEHNIVFIATPGHSPGSVCISIDNILFSGDTLMPFKPFIKKRNGGSMEQFQESVRKIVDCFPEESLVYPGHGEVGKLKDYKI
jgi:glyoxylase-like metal-dependent hydrolase (beta-lactamase superfamily II)